MAYDAELADRLRLLLGGQPNLSEKPMFGGLAFLVGGNLALSASSRGGLLLRVAPERTDELVESPGVSRFQMRGREMDGWLHVESEAYDDDPAHDDLDDRDARLAHWVRMGVEYAASLPVKR